MASNARKERRQLWWKQHGKQVEDPKDIKKPKMIKKSFHKGDMVPKKDQSASSSAPQKEENGKKKTRFIVFVGNLPFHLEKEDIVHHFRCAGGVTDFRLMTKKDSGTSKGCGFLELDDFVSYEKALNLHHSVVGGRKINVEVTCGGGGSGEKRVGKLNEKKKKFRQRRGKKSKSIKDESDNVDKKGENEQNNPAEKKRVDSSLKTIKKMKKEQIDNTGIMDESMEIKSATLKLKKRKLKDDATGESCGPKQKKKSLKQSNAMNSMVKELELDKMVQEKQDKSIKF